VADSLLSSDLPFGDATLQTASDWRTYIDRFRDSQRQKLEQADRERSEAKAKEIIAANTRDSCLQNLKAGDPESKAYGCGYPDHTNSDLHSDQLIYPDAIIVYIDKGTHTVENVQWSH
jgi:ribonuclease HII